MKVPLTNCTSIQISRALSVGAADLYYEPRNGRPSIRRAFAKVSTDVETQSKAGRLDAVETHPTTSPITKLDAGQTMRATQSGGVALLVITSESRLGKEHWAYDFPIGATKTTYLRSAGALRELLRSVAAGDRYAHRAAPRHDLRVWYGSVPRLTAAACGVVARPMA